MRNFFRTQEDQIELRNRIKGQRRQVTLNHIRESVFATRYCFRAQFKYHGISWTVLIEAMWVEEYSISYTHTRSTLSCTDFFILLDVAIFFIEQLS